MDPLVSGFLTSAAADVLMGNIHRFRDRSFEDYVGDAINDTAEEFDGLEPEHLEIVLRSDTVHAEVERYKGGGPPPSMDTLTAELTRITNLYDELEHDAVVESF